MIAGVVAACVVAIAIVARDAWLRWLAQQRWFAERSEAQKPDLDALRAEHAHLVGRIVDAERRLAAHDDALRETRVRGSMGGR